jgi:hypothetical protein
VTGTNFSGEMPMFPGTVEVIGLPMFVADPAVVPCVYVRSVRVARSLRIIARRSVAAAVFRSTAAARFGSTFWSATRSTRSAFPLHRRCGGGSACVTTRRRGATCRDVSMAHFGARRRLRASRRGACAVILATAFIGAPIFAAAIFPAALLSAHTKRKRYREC